MDLIENKKNLPTNESQDGIITAKLHQRDPSNPNVQMKNFENIYMSRKN